ncbi:hypothetical protein [Marmoricola sp. URHB0036]|uniref:hypothetical protein n=1 Tax=Marmoricola sp. URHB0036 TaxID=1298863 RepID=UPI0004806B41|nr:hypothetical protein [Marmoricola sp. URHB0036]
MSSESSTVLTFVVGAALTLLWLAALVQAWRMSDAAFASQREREVVFVAMVIFGWLAAVVWFVWYRRQLQDELNRKSLVDL